MTQRHSIASKSFGAFLLVLHLGACATTNPHQTTIPMKKATAIVNKDRANRNFEAKTHPATSLAGDREAHPLLIRLADGRKAIERKKLLKFQQRGAQQFIQDVSVRPFFSRGRFFGWRVLAYRGPGKLLPGDVVHRVNGRRIERPGEVMTVWEEMTQKNSFIVELLRNGRPLTMKIPIVDRPAP